MNVDFSTYLMRMKKFKDCSYFSVEQQPSYKFLILDSKDTGEIESFIKDLNDFWKAELLEYNRMISNSLSENQFQSQFIEKPIFKDLTIYFPYITYLAKELLNFNIIIHLILYFLQANVSMYYFKSPVL